MRSFLVGLVALGGLLADVAPASAAWDNVFQPTLFGRLRRNNQSSGYYTPPVVVSSSPVVAYASPVVAYSAPVVAQSSPCATGCPTPCSTSSTQRCYYQPVTTMETKTYYEPVTTYTTSYYYEQVTSYRYSSYYDPCTCSYQQVATPVCNMELRAKSCPVQSWVARCAQVPKTTMVKSCYLEPKTTCCTTTTGPLIPVPAGVDPATAAPPTITPTPPMPTPPPVTTPPPSIGESRSSPPTSPPSVYDRYYPTTPGTSFRPSLGAPIPASSPTPPAPPVKLERIALGGSSVEGQVVRSDNSPKAGAKVLFVNTANGSREVITANVAGRFQTNLPSGSWLVYLHGADDTPLFYTRVNVGGASATPVKLVSR